MRKSITQFILILVLANHGFGSLLEKAKIIDSILGNVDSEMLFHAFDDTTQIGNSLKNISRYQDRGQFERNAYIILQQNLGEIVIRHFELNELKILEEIHSKGGEYAKFALRVLCMSSGNDNELSQKLREVIQYPPPPPRGHLLTPVPVVVP